MEPEGSLKLFKGAPQLAPIPSQIKPHHPSTRTPWLLNKKMLCPTLQATLRITETRCEACDKIL